MGEEIVNDAVELDKEICVVDAEVTNDKPHKSNNIFVFHLPLPTLQQKGELALQAKKSSDSKQKKWSIDINQASYSFYKNGPGTPLQGIITEVVLHRWK
jgi:hypothetical protein